MRTLQRLVGCVPVATALDTSTRQVQRMAEAGSIPAVMVGSKQLRFDPDLVAEALAPDEASAARLAEAIRLAAGGADR